MISAGERKVGSLSKSKWSDTIIILTVTNGSSNGIYAFVRS